MKEAGYIISNYCIIRNQNVFKGKELLYSSGEKVPSAFFVEIYRHLMLNYPKFHKMDNLCKLGFLCSEILLGGGEINARYNGSDVGLVFYNAASSIDSDRIHQASITDRTAYFPSPSVFVYTLANIVIGEICIRQKFFGESEFFIAEKFDAGALHDYVKQLLDDGAAECCLAGWIESDGEHYEGVMVLIEKSPAGTGGIAIFEPENLDKIYLQGK